MRSEAQNVRKGAKLKQKLTNGWETKELRGWDLSHRQRFRNGSYTYNFTDPQSGAIDAGIIDAWFANIVEGKHRYDYGNTFDNFCWNREIVPESEWLPSLFRSAQLFVSVQVPIRIAVLLSVTHRFIMLYAAARFRSLARTNKSTHLAAMYFLFNEMLYISSLFLYYSLHIWQDLHCEFPVIEKEIKEPEM
ncbi:unnamed protein product [Nippostrongylus brasiliensis]|uniref:TLC domain-containing protein n=1 Tax=Nippostrongylus brasiliensis TaxID=27835 RepID=A0A0N4YCT4_NIPBR|nr:unnamed protein product [Nippostrongylus brasiliensis]